MSGENYRLSFGEDGRLSGQAGCNRFSGPFTEEGRVLRPGAIIVTRMACPGPRMDHERHALAVLGARSAAAFVGGDMLVLSGRDHSIRLRRD